ncbi:MAG TPA: phosphate signaling complex protein PhoU [Longimicrobium sp.]|jgi:phosphate transport system protein|uniref:phosphate signaling complex protein PhoU n=1 Tax=Longimicrobium sp. TaxID=2029185 RepID=UPI002ED9FFED
MTPTPGVRHFHEELARLKTQLLTMSGLAEELVDQAMQALRARDADLARTVIQRDNDLDAMEVAVDDMCIHLLALQQPMARDLRLITMAMKISNDLERVGDHAVNIAEAVGHLAEQPIHLEFAEIDEMGRLATEMLSDALDTFVRADPEGAREVCRRDDRVDGLHNSLFRILLTHMMEDPRRIGASMSLFLVSRNLERIADLATNIAEDVVFLVEGRNIKHGAGLVSGEARAS